MAVGPRSKSNKGQRFQGRANGLAVFLNYHAVPWCAVGCNKTESDVVFQAVRPNAIGEVTNPLVALVNAMPVKSQLRGRGVIKLHTQLLAFHALAVNATQRSDTHHIIGHIEVNVFA